MPDHRAVEPSGRRPSPSRHFVGRAAKLASSAPREAVLVLAAASIALCLKLILALTTYGTNDVFYWQTFVEAIQRGGVDVYRRVEIFNHPPFMIHVLGILGWLDSVTPFSFPFLIRLPGIVADVGTVWLLWRLTRSDPVASSRWAVAAVALAPVSIAISGFHGNTDPVMIFLVVLAVYLVGTRSDVLGAGIAFGMSMNIKVAPLIFAPAFLAWLPGRRERLRFAGAAAAVVVVGSLPYLLQEPVLIVRRVLGYGSLFGHWGLSRLAGSLAPGSTATEVYRRVGGYAVLALVAALVIVLRRRAPGLPLFVVCALSASTFLALTPGFGVQYLAWLVPWVVAFGLGGGLLFHLTSGLFLIGVYTFWSGGFPWDYANSLVAGDWTGGLVYLEVLTWATVVGLWLSGLRSTFVGRGVPAGPAGNVFDGRTTR